MIKLLLLFFYGILKISGSATLPPLTTATMIPQEPINFMMTGKTTTTISLAWQPPASVNNLDITNYLIDYNVQGGSRSK